MIYWLDLLGTLAFAVTGAYKAKDAQLSVFGVIFLGILTAVGGGTVRDLIIDRAPLFYLKDPHYFLVCILAGLAIFLGPTFFKKRYSFFRFIDSVGLSVFTIIGVSAVYNHLYPGEELAVISCISCIFLGILTGVGGGVLRDSIMGDPPLALKKGSNYVFSAFWGSSIFYFLMFWNRAWAIGLSIGVTLVLREIISEYGVYKKVFKKNGENSGASQ